MVWAVGAETAVIAVEVWDLAAGQASDPMMRATFSARVGGGGTRPRAIYDPDPDYSDAARKAKYQGSVVLWLVVGADGLPHNIRVQRSLGMGLDEKAVAAVSTWRFQPATLNGQPVAVEVNVEVSFRLY